MVYRYDSSLFVANAEDFRRRALASVDRAESDVEWFVLNAEANVEVAPTAVDALDELRETLAERSIVFAMVRVKHELEELLDAAGFLTGMGPDRLFMTLATAVDAYRKWYMIAMLTTPDLEENV